MPAYIVTPALRQQVKSMAERGVSREAIGAALKMDIKTLRKHFRQELDEADAKIASDISQKIEALAGFGLPQEDIGYIVNLSARTLRDTYRHELDSGGARAKAKIAQRLFQKAMNGDTACLIFWLKARAAWSDRPAEEAVDPKIVVTGGLPDAPK